MKRIIELVIIIFFLLLVITSCSSESGDLKDGLDELTKEYNSLVEIQVLTIELKIDESINKAYVQEYLDLLLGFEPPNEEREAYLLERINNTYGVNLKKIDDVKQKYIDCKSTVANFDKEIKKIELKILKLDKKKSHIYLRLMELKMDKLFIINDLFPQRLIYTIGLSTSELKKISIENKRIYNSLKKKPVGKDFSLKSKKESMSLFSKRDFLISDVIKYQ